MPGFARDPLTITWLGLTLATVLSWQVSSGDPRGAGVGVLVIAFVKARFVVSVFMGVRRAPPALRWICDAWVVLAGIAVVAAYWWGSLAVA